MARQSPPISLRNAAVAIAAAEFGMIGSADAQSTQKLSGLEEEQMMSLPTQAQSP